MLLGAGQRSWDSSSARDSVHNYYEKMAEEQLIRANDRASHDPEFMADVLCVALNNLPPRYVRHDVDMTFFLSPIEHDEMSDKVAIAVSNAIAYVQSREMQAEPQQESKPTPKKRR